MPDLIIELQHNIKWLDGRSQAKGHNHGVPQLATGPQKWVVIKYFLNSGERNCAVALAISDIAGWLCGWVELFKNPRGFFFSIFA